MQFHEYFLFTRRHAISRVFYFIYPSDVSTMILAQETEVNGRVVVLRIFQTKFSSSMVVFPSELSCFFNFSRMIIFNLSQTLKSTIESL